MKILHVSLWPIDKSSIGGTEKYVIDLSTALSKHSIDNEVMMLSGRQNIINGVSFLPVHIAGIDKLDEYSVKSTFFSEFNSKSLKAFCDQIDHLFDFSKYDLIHFNSLLFYFCAKDKRKIFTIHTNPTEFDQNWGKESFSTICSIIKNDCNFSKFIAPSAHYAKIYSKMLDRVVEFIPHSLSDHIVKSYDKKCTKQDGILDIFVPSRLEIEQKGQDILLESLALIKNQLPNFRVTMSGSDNQYLPNAEILKNIAAKNNISVAIKNLEPHEMFAAYCMADITILPSRYESFGYAALQSLWLGKRTVMSAIPTHEEIAEGNDCAFLAEESNTQAFADKILQALQSKPKAPDKSWLDRYDSQKWIDTYINFYKTCLNQ
jgi:glycosyltransferase involved in cell wall biosynthesis